MTVFNDIEIKNLTPHKLNLFTKDGTELIIPSSGFARVSSEFKEQGEINGIIYGSMEYGEVTGLPEPTPNTIYVVSAIVKARCPNRADLYCVTNYVRDSENNIIGAEALSH